MDSKVAGPGRWVKTSFLEKANEWKNQASSLLPCTKERLLESRLPGVGGMARKETGVRRQESEDIEQREMRLAADRHSIAQSAERRAKEERS
jgi:hypothetical protein